MARAVKKERRFNATQNQASAIVALAYWVADTAYIRERYGDNEPELDRARDTASYNLKECDRWEIPYWVQNEVCAFAGDWHRYKSEYLREALAKKGIRI